MNKYSKSSFEKMDRQERLIRIYNKTILKQYKVIKNENGFPIYLLSFILFLSYLPFLFNGLYFQSGVIFTVFIISIIVKKEINKINKKRIQRIKNKRDLIIKESLLSSEDFVNIAYNAFKTGALDNLDEDTIKTVLKKKKELVVKDFSSNELYIREIKFMEDIKNTDNLSELTNE